MMSVAVLIDKLSEIERSIGVETDQTIRNQVIDAQDCALRVQAEIVEMLRIESIQDAVRIVPDVFMEASLPRSGWRGAFAAILPLTTLSPLWRR
jgi:hypothetical protein